MSYDIILSAADESGTFLSPDDQTQARGAETFSRIERRVREVVGGNVTTGTPPSLEAATLGEVTVADTGLQVVLSREAAEVSFPAREHADLDMFHDQVRQVIRIVQEETGWDAYDPQTGQAFDGQFHGEARPDEFVDPTGVVEPDLAGMPPQPSLTGPVLRDQPLTAPPVTQAEGSTALLKNLKRRAITSFILAVVILGFAIWDLTVGSVGWFTWVLVVIGAVNVLVGLMVVVRTKGFTDAGSLR